MFSVLPTIDGFDVIDEATGHPVDHRETRQSANGVAYALNGALSDPSAATTLWGTKRPYERKAAPVGRSARRERP